MVIVVRAEEGPGYTDLYAGVSSPPPLCGDDQSRHRICNAGRDRRLLIEPPSLQGKIQHARIRPVPEVSRRVESCVSKSSGDSLGRAEIVPAAEWNGHHS